MQSLNTISVTLQCSSRYQSPSPPKLMILAWTYNDYVLNVTDSLLFLPSTKGFSARVDQKGFFSSLRFYFSSSHADSPIVGTSDIGQVSTQAPLCILHRVCIHLCPQMVSGYQNILKNRKQDIFHLEISELAQRYNQHHVPDYVGPYLPARLSMQDPCRHIPQEVHLSCITTRTESICTVIPFTND